MMRLRETIGWLLNLLCRVRLWKSPDWFTADGYTTRGYGRLSFYTGEFRFPVRCLEEY